MKNEIIDTKEGLAYISASGIKYDILEGKHTDGDISSDILFVFLNNPDYNCADHFVGYTYGAYSLKNNECVRKDYQEVFDNMTQEFERKNRIKRKIYTDYDRFKYRMNYGIRPYEYLVDFEKSDAMYNYLKQHGIENDGGYVFAESMRYCVKTNKIHDSIIRREFAFA